MLLSLPSYRLWWIPGALFRFLLWDRGPHEPSCQEYWLLMAHRWARPSSYPQLEEAASASFSLGSSIHPMAYDSREMKPGPLPKLRTSLKGHPSFHIPPWVSLSCYCIRFWLHLLLLPHSLTTPKETCSKLAISEPASQENWPPPTS